MEKYHIYYHCKLTPGNCLKKHGGSDSQQGTKHMSRIRDLGTHPIIHLTLQFNMGIFTKKNVDLRCWGPQFISRLQPIHRPFLHLKVCFMGLTQPTMALHPASPSKVNLTLQGLELLCALEPTSSTNSATQM